MNEKGNFNVVVLFVPHLTAGARGGKVRIAYFQGGLAESEGKKIGGFSWMPTLPGVVPVR